MKYIQLSLLYQNRLIFLMYLFSSFSLRTFSQPSKENIVSCYIINRIINTDEFQNDFFICSSLSDTIYIVDNSCIFSNCQEQVICDKTIIFSNKIPKVERIIIYNVEIKNNYLIVYLYKPAISSITSLELEGPVLVFSISISQNPFKITLIGRGFF